MSNDYLFIVSRNHNSDERFSFNRDCVPRFLFMFKQEGVAKCSNKPRKTADDGVGGEQSDKSFKQKDKKTVKRGNDWYHNFAPPSSYKFLMKEVSKFCSSETE